MTSGYAIILVLFLAAASRAQEPGVELSDDEIQMAAADLRKALAGPGEEAFVQILTEVNIVQDLSIDTAFVYDLVVRFDADRYRNPQVGLYPLNFEDQFILWGKRVALYTRSTYWQSKRFYLHHIASGRQAWIFTEDARRLTSVSVAKWPPVATPITPAVFDKWLKIIRAVEPGTDLRSMSRWFRLMHHESREAVVQRLGQGG